MMQAYKLKGKIDQSGNLIITESVDISPGDVEAIVVKAEVEKNIESVTHTTSPPSAQTEITGIPCRTKIFRDWFANSQPVLPDFDPEQARVEYLQEK